MDQRQVNACTGWVPLAAVIKGPLSVTCADALLEDTPAALFDPVIVPVTEITPAVVCNIPAALPAVTLPMTETVPVLALAIPSAALPLPPVTLPVTLTIPLEALLIP